MIGILLITYLTYCFSIGYRRGMVRQIAPVISWLLSFLIQRPLIMVLRTTKYWEMVYEGIYNYILANFAELSQHSFITTQVNNFSYRLTSMFFWFISYLCISMILKSVFRCLFVIERLPLIGTASRAAGGFISTGMGIFNVVIIFFVVNILSTLQIPVAVAAINLLNSDMLIQYLLHMLPL